MNVNAVVMKQVVIDMTNYLYMIVEDCLLWRIVVLIEEALQLILVFQMNAEGKKMFFMNYQSISEIFFVRRSIL